MTPKQERFVSEYLKDLNATQAYIRAGYSKGGADRNAHALMGNHEISVAIAKRTAKQLDKNDLSAARVLEEMRRLAFSDMRGFFDANGNLKSIATLTEEQGAVLAASETIIKNAKAGDGITDEICKIKLHDKPRALEMLAKYYGLLTEKVEHSGEISFTWLDQEK